MITKIYSVIEYGCIYPERAHLTSGESLQQVIMPDAEFDTLCNYIETQLTDETVEDKIFRIFYKKHQKVVKAQNQVGVIQFANGIQIEVLPKIVVQSGEDEREFLRKLLLCLLSHVKDYPYLIAGDAQLSAKKDYPILEVFISSYIRELNNICMNGLKNGYEQVRDNLGVMKGKLLIPENIKRNKFSLNKFYCQYQRYTPNNPVNRIIKATLNKLLSTSKTFQNRDKIYRLLDIFSQVESNKNLESDLQRTQQLDRTYKDYMKVMMWSRLFLSNSSVTSTQGNVINTSIMFPMEKVFEDYIAFLFKKYSKDYVITAQDRSIFLVTHRNRGKFRLRPDVVVEKNDAPVLIVDTKWKVLDAYNNKRNYGISQSDMYQLYAYGKKYEIEHNKGHKNKIKPPHLVLLYPENENFKKKLDNFIYEGDLELDVIPFSFAVGKEEEQILHILDLISTEAKDLPIYDGSYMVADEQTPLIPIIDNYDFQKMDNKEGYIPVYDLKAACGSFEGNEIPVNKGWIYASGHDFTPNPEKHFVVSARGNSMSPRIENGDLCVFELYKAGSRKDKIVLMKSNGIDKEYDCDFTIKKYHSEKDAVGNHKRIWLSPLNYDGYDDIELDPNEEYRTIGVFKCVLSI